MEKSEICPDTCKPSIMKKPRLGAEVTKRSRFHPKNHGKSSLESVLELLTDPNREKNPEVIDRSFRLNGELLALPQNKEEDQLLDMTLWNYQLNRYANNLI